MGESTNGHVRHDEEIVNLAATETNSMQGRPEGELEGQAEGAGRVDVAKSRSCRLGHSPLFT